jgi:hypothetical protein
MKVRTILSDVYMFVILAVSIWGPLITLHGYRQWWVVTFYAAFACAAIGGSISHYRLVGRNRSTEPASRRHRHLPARQHRILPTHA